MLARLCGCDRPMLLEPPACHRCGRDTEQRVTASTARLAAAIAEYMLHGARSGTARGQHNRFG